MRSDDLVRLLTSNPGEGLDVLIEKSDRHASLVITRNKELWGDQGAESDVLTVNGTNLLNPATAPITKRLIGLFAFDAGSDGVSNLGASAAGAGRTARSSRASTTTSRPRRTAPARWRCR